MKNKILSESEKGYLKQLESHVPKIDPIYGLEGYVHDICLAADIRKGRPICCETPDCYESVIPYRWNNPSGKTAYDRQLNPFGYYECIRCGAIYPEMKEDDSEKEENRAAGNKRLVEIAHICLEYNKALTNRDKIYTWGKSVQS